MSDQLRHSLDDCDELPTERSEPANDAERAELYKRMAFEADKEVKRLQDSMQRRLDALRQTQRLLTEVRALARQADDELANLQRLIAAGEFYPSHLKHLENARAALTAAKEGWE